MNEPKKIFRVFTFLDKNSTGMKLDQVITQHTIKSKTDTNYILLAYDSGRKTKHLAKAAVNGLSCGSMSYASVWASSWTFEDGISEAQQRTRDAVEKELEKSLAFQEKKAATIKELMEFMKTAEAKVERRNADDYR